MEKIWRLRPTDWLMLIAAIGLAGAISFDGLKPMLATWLSAEEYGYGVVIPLVVAFFIWQKREVLERLGFEGSWTGLLVLIVGVALSYLGELSTLYVVIQYAFVVIIAGVALTLVGWKGFRLLWAPLVLLLFMIPLPNFLYQGISAETQLISSKLGVALIRLIGISVFLEGNVIDLGSYKLQVEEACNGLRYLFPLMSLGFIAAYLFKAPWWKRALLFISTIPITILMNSFRIAAIGVLVDRWGTAMAEGFLHDFEGWVVFMGCIGVLVFEMWALSRIGNGVRPFREAFRIDFPARRPPDAVTAARPAPRPFWAALVLLAVVTMSFAALPLRVEVPLQRRDLSQFPMRLGDWQGRQEPLQAVYIDALKLTDYLLADYAAEGSAPVNLYVAYYASQRKGESAHSPRSCIPGDGWQIESLDRRTLDATVSGKPLHVYRVVIRKGNTTQLVYYWFQQRGRILTNEYVVKWYLFWDALTRNRTDGALVRLITSIDPTGNMEKADTQLATFASVVARQLTEHVPN